MALLTPFKLSLAIRMQVSYSSCFPPEETCAFYQKCSELLCVFPYSKLPDGFEFFPCLFNWVSSGNNDSMKLKKYQESSTAKPFSAGALVALGGLPGSDPSLRTHTLPRSQHISSWGCQTLSQWGWSRAALHAQGGMIPRAAWGHCAAPEGRASGSHLPVSHPDIHK